MLSGHKLCSIKSEDTNDYLCLSDILLRNLQFKNYSWSDRLGFYIRHFFHRLQKDVCSLRSAL